jgi:hypothetical protein
LSRSVDSRSLARGFRDNVKGLNLDPQNTPMLKAVYVQK